MTNILQARTAYASASSSPIRTARDSEYTLFARATHALTTVDEGDKAQYRALARAVRTNQTLWGTLADDLVDDGNALPVPLRAQLLSLAGFVSRHSLSVLAGSGSVAPLIDINTAIMKGLRGDVEVAT